MNQLPVSPLVLVMLLVIVGGMAALMIVGRVPLSYNFRNLTVRWRMTLLTALAFTLVISLLTVMLALAFTLVISLPFTKASITVSSEMTLLTALAFTLVISLLTVMLAFVNGMVKLTDGSGYKENVVVLADGANDEAFSSMSFTDVSNIGRRPGKNESYPASRELYVIASMPIPPQAVQ